MQNGRLRFMQKSIDIKLVPPFKLDPYAAFDMSHWRSWVKLQPLWSARGLHDLEVSHHLNNTNLHYQVSKKLPNAVPS